MTRWMQWLGPVAMVVATGVCLGQAPESDKFLATDGAYGDQFGHSVAVDGDVMVIGSVKDDEAATDTGAARVFRFDGTTWVEEQKLVPAAGGLYRDYFGCSVDVSGNRIVVGAYGVDDTTRGDDSGLAYVFSYGGGVWTQEAELFASDGAKNDNFGWAVSISGELVMVGAPRHSDSILESGVVYAFRRHSVFGWMEEQKLFPLDEGSYEYFGKAVALEGEVVLIGTPDDNEGGSDAGAAYVFRFDGSNWQEEQKLAPADVAGSDHFGHAVSLSGVVALIGSPYDDDMGRDSGSAYLFRRQGGSWNEETKFVPEDGIAYDAFGSALATTGTLVIVGSPFADLAYSDSGAIYSYVARNKNWALDFKMAASDAGSSDRLGGAVDVQGNRAFVGAEFDDDSASNAGAIYLFSVGEFVLTAEPGSVQVGDQLTFTAFCGEPLDPVLLVATQVNGIPYFAPIVLWWFSSDYHFRLSANVPGTVGTYTVGFTAFKIDCFGNIALSNVAQVDFQ